MADKEDGASIRYKVLVQVAERSLQESIKALTLERLVECYAHIASRDKGRADLQKALLQTAEFWKTTALKEFKAVFEERDIKRKLGELDELVNEARQRKQAWEDRNKGEGPVRLVELTPQDIALANLRDLKLRRISELEQQIQDLRTDNKRLQAEAVAKEDRLQHILTILSSSLADLELAAKGASGLPSRESLADFFSVVARRLLEV
jgi:kinetochore protein NNF1